MSGQGLKESVALMILKARTNDEGAVAIPQHEDASEDEAADAEPVAHHTVRRALPLATSGSCMVRGFST